MCDINSDYTPKDFLEKLAIKPQVYEVPEHLRLSHQPRLTYELKQSQNPKVESIKRIKFKALSPRRGPTNGLNYLQTPRKSTEKSSLKVFKTDVAVKNYLNPQKMNVIYRHDQLSTSNIKNQTSNQQHEAKETSILSGSKSLQNLKITKEIKNAQKACNQSKHVQSEQDLTIKKTQMILEALLKNKINDSQIKNIISTLNEGLKSPESFDRIIEGSQISKQTSLITSSNRLHQMKSFKDNKSSSLQNKRVSKLSAPKRIKSESKTILVPKTKREKKAFQGSVKESLLKQVKRIKQLVLVNQKSLKLSKKLSMK